MLPHLRFQSQTKGVSFMQENIGILHPGEMGISVAASAQNSGHDVYWVSAGRSLQTRRRAQTQALLEAHSLAELCRVCTIIISVCPPHAAEEVARQVVGHSFRGIYADFNAIAPQRAVRLEQMMAGPGIAFVDGGVIGGPAWEAGKTWLYLSGRESPRIANCFAAGPLETETIGDEIGRASALKMCYAAYSKGTTALLAAILGTAESLGVRQELAQQWSRGDSDFAGQAEQRVRRVTAKAWRFAGEMEEIAATFAGAGMPDGFHEAAADLYRRLAAFKDQETTPALTEVMTALRDVVSRDAADG
jgi:3-hydroxyisobutyrate dehydrogenase-like beta-hydroxyacid dehydrogenase